MDGALSASDRAEVMAHVGECAECLRELEQLQRVDRLYRDLQSLRAPAHFEQEVHLRLRRKSRRMVLSPWALVPALAAAGVMVVVAAVYLAAPRGKGMEMASAPQAARSLSVPSTASKEEFAAATPKEDGVGSAAPAPVSPTGGVQEKELRQSMVLDAQAKQVPEKPVFAAPPAAVPAQAPPPAAPKTEMIESRRVQNAAGIRAEPEVNVKTAAERIFDLRDGVWTQREYAGEKLIELGWDSEEMAKLTASQPRLNELRDLGNFVIFEIDGKWYKFMQEDG